MFKKLLLLSLIVSTSACISTKTITLNNENTGSINNKTIVDLHRDYPIFMDLRFTEVIFPLLQAFDKGNARLVDNNIEDPEKEISGVMLQALQDKYNLKKIKSNFRGKSSFNVKKISDAFNDVDLVLESRVVQRMVIYYPINFWIHGLRYHIQVRLIDTKSSSIIAQGYCKWMPRIRDTARVGKLYRNNAAMLKEQFKEAKKVCLGQLKSKLLNI